jgi:lipid A 3-O-deacylase
VNSAKWIWVMAIAVALSSMTLAQAGPEAGGNEIQVWTGAGHSVAGGTGSTRVFNAGLRYGWVLTEPRGPGFLKGSFEYVVDGVPLFLVFQPANTAYGVGVNPLGLKWDFVPHGSFVPYAELGGGLLFSTHDVPTRTSWVNFTPSAAFGVHVLGSKLNCTVELRYMHISNAGLSSRNPGLNTLQVRVGLGMFRGGGQGNGARHGGGKP